MMLSIVAPGCAFNCIRSILEITGPAMFHHKITNYTNMSPWTFVSLFLLSFIFAPDADIISYVSFFLHIFRSLFSFSLRTNFIKSVLFCVGRVRLVLIGSTKVYYFLVVYQFYLVFCISDCRSKFSFLEKKFWFQKIIIQSVCGYLLFSLCAI